MGKKNNKISNGVENIYDIIIVGAGPAGLTAGIYAARREMKTLVIGKEVGGQMIWASEIENYPGFKSINSYDLVMKMQEQVKALGVEIKTTEIKKIDKNEEGFTLYTNKEEYKTKTVIMALGLSPRRLAIPGEAELAHKGVSYCANCDGPFYKSKVIAVAGGGNSALDAAEVLSKIGKQVYLIHRRDEFRAFEVLIEDVKERDNIELLLDTEIKEIIGKDRVEKIKVVNNKTQEEKEIAVDGVFVEVGRIANTDLVADLVERDKKDQIIVDENQNTKTPGLFAAGDVTNKSNFKQITIAMGEATIAALAAYQYLQLKRK